MVSLKSANFTTLTPTKTAGSLYLVLCIFREKYDSDFDLVPKLGQYALNMHHRLIY